MLKMGGIDPEKLYRATLSWACGRLSPWKSSKRQIADLKGPNLLRKLERPENNKKKNNLPFDLKNGQLIVWLCHALNCLPWQSCQSPGRVCSVTWRALSIPGSFVEKQGDSRGEREIGEATHADFFRAVRRFFWFILPCFLQFLSFFFSKIKSCPNNFIYVFSLRWWISNYDL